MVAIPRRAVHMSAKQDVFFRAVRHRTCQIAGFVAGRGSGKTEIGAITICMSARAGDPWMVVSPDNNVIRETTWPTFERVARRLGVWIRGVQSPTPRAYIRTYDGGRADVVFKGAEVPDKLRGASKAGLWFDELSVISEDAFLCALPVLRWRGRLGPCMATFTPKGRRHWSFNLFYQQASREDADWYHRLAKTAGHDGASAETGLTKICEAIYRPKQGTALVTAATWDNPFRPVGFEQLLAGRYTSLFAQQELAGQFIDLQGTMFRREWFRWADAVPEGAIRIRYWDLADTDGEGCWTVGTLLAIDEHGQVYVEDVVRGQWSAGMRDRMIFDTARLDSIRYDNEVIVYVEQEPGSGGKHQASDMIRRLSTIGVPVYRDLPSGTRYKNHEGERIPGLAKIVRARPASAAAENGQITVVYGNWCTDWLDELCAFPYSSAADQVDSFAAGYLKIVSRQCEFGGDITIVPPAGAVRVREALQAQVAGRGEQQPEPQGQQQPTKRRRY